VLKPKRSLGCWNIAHGDFHKWKYPNSWVVYLLENPNKKWMIWGFPFMETWKHLETLHINALTSSNWTNIP